MIKKRKTILETIIRLQHKLKYAAAAHARERVLFDGRVDRIKKVYDKKTARHIKVITCVVDKMYKIAEQLERKNGR